MFQRFITALTRGGPGGTPRPIEMHAHDPRRYVGYGTTPIIYAAITYASIIYASIIFAAVLSA